jgi:hypothetical protein
MPSTPPPLPQPSDRYLQRSLPRRSGQAGSASTVAHDSSARNHAVVIGAVAGLAMLLLMLLLLIAAASIGIGLGLNSPNIGAGQQGNSSGSSADDEPSSPEADTTDHSSSTDSSMPSPPQSESTPNTDKSKSDPGTEQKSDDTEPSGSTESGATITNEVVPADGSDVKGKHDGAGRVGDSDSDQSESGNVFSIGGGSFFGLKAEKGSVVYVVDCSASMMGEPYDRARKELLRSVGALKHDQAYFVFLFSDGSYPMYFPHEHNQLVLATPKNLKALKDWLDDFLNPGGTQPEESLVKAIALRPRTIFFLTDGEFDPSVADIVRKANNKKITINTIGFVNRAGEPLLKLIAKQNSGKYLFVP